MPKTLTGAEHTEMLKLRDDLLATLTEAMKARPKLDDWESSPYGSEPMWAIHERQAMVDAVDRHQRKTKRPGVLAAEVYAVEQSAMGHVDYAEKFALRVAFLAYGLDWRA